MVDVRLDGRGEGSTKVGGGRATELAYAHVRAGILSGELPPGTLLAEKDLAERLDISRTPVRQALRRLLQEDLLEVGYRRQLAVRAVSPEVRHEVFLVRAALERISVQEACQQMPIEEIDELRLLLMRQKRAIDAGDTSQLIELDEEFHQRIASGGNLPTVVRFLAHLRAFIRLMGIEALSKPGRAEAVLEEHEQIVDALEARDAKAAEAAMASHLDHTVAVLASLHDDGERKRPRRRAPARAGAGKKG